MLVRVLRWSLFFEKTRERSNRNNQTAECKESPLKDWFVHGGKPRLIRMDPDGCYMSNEMLDTLYHDLGLNTEVIPEQAPWKLSITRVIMRLVKRTAHIYALDQDVTLPVKSVFCKLWWPTLVFSNMEGILLYSFSLDVSQLRLKAKRLDDEEQGRSITESMAERLARKQSVHEGMVAS